jgi:hypothetical protein
MKCVSSEKGNAEKRKCFEVFGQKMSKWYYQAVMDVPSMRKMR